MSGVFFNKGENCIAAGRIFVEKKIHGEFVKRVVSISHTFQYAFFCVKGYNNELANNFLK